MKQQPDTIDAENYWTCNHHKGRVKKRYEVCLVRCVASVTAQLTSHDECLEWRRAYIVANRGEVI